MVSPYLLISSLSSAINKVEMDNSLSVLALFSYLLISAITTYFLFRHSLNTRSLKAKIISTKALTLILITVLALLTVGCKEKAERFTTQVKEDLIQITSSGEEGNSQKVFPGRGTPTPVTIVNEETGVPATFDPALTADVDIVSWNINYRVILPKDYSEYAEKQTGRRGSGVTITSLIPKTIDNKQEVLSVQFSREPSKIYDLGNNRYAEFTFKNPKEDFEIQIITRIKLFRYDLSTALKNPNPAPLTDGDLKEYLKEEKYLEKDHPAIKEIALQINGKDEIDTVRKIYEFVLDNMEYDHAKADNDIAKALGAAGAVQLKKGVCVEYADLFVALCRAKGIPAKYVAGIPTEGENERKGHAWVEVYLENYGWVPFDPTWGDTKAATFESLKPLYIYLSDIRNDEVLGYSDIYGYLYWGVPFKVDHSMSIDSSRAGYLKELLSIVNKNKSELDQMKKQLDVSASGVESAKAEMDQIKNSLEQVKRELESGRITDPGEYERLVSKHNSLVSSYNEKVAAYNKKVNAYQGVHGQYEAKRQEVNALVNKYNSLR